MRTAGQRGIPVGTDATNAALAIAAGGGTASGATATAGGGPGVAAESKYRIVATLKYATAAIPAASAANALTDANVARGAMISSRGSGPSRASRAFNRWTKSCDG